MWSDPSEDDANTRWVRQYHEAIHPYSGHEGGYTNFMAGDDDDRAKANYGASYRRLARIKARVDPGNLFSLNQNVPPRE